MSKSKGKGKAVMEAPMPLNPYVECHEGTSFSVGLVERKDPPDFLVMQECYNICMAAYKEFMSLAVKENSWVENVPVLGAVEELQHVFQEPPAPGMVIEYSVGSGIVPISIDKLVNSMIDVEKWASVFSDIVHYGTAEVPSGIMSGLVTKEQPHQRKNFKCLRAINTELLWPICAPARIFSFIRFVKEVIPNIYAVVDVSADYFPHFDTAMHVNCKRRPSGVIVRRHEGHSEVIWIENMEVPEYNVKNSMYSGVKINQAFDAKRWLSMLSSHEKRIRSIFLNFRLQITDPASWIHDAHLTLAKMLKTGHLANLNYIAEHPNECLHIECDIQEDGGFKIWKEACAEGSNNYIAVRTFRVKATPRSVFIFLVQGTPQLQWPRREFAEPEEVVKLVTDDSSSCFTVHAKNITQTGFWEQARQLPFELQKPEDYEYVLQEASSDEFCSSIISSLPISLYHYSSALRHEEASYSLRPSGYSIIPDGSRGILSDASIVTLAWQQVFGADVETGEVIERTRNLAKDVIDAIRGAESANQLVERQSISKHLSDVTPKLSTF